MSVRALFVLAFVILSPEVRAWVLTGHKFSNSAAQIRLGDLCDSSRFLSTPGSCSGDAANPDWRNEFITAGQRWNQVTSNFEFMFDPGPGAASPGYCSPSDPSSAFFLQNACGSAFGASTIALARIFSLLDGEVVHADVVFNAGKSWSAFDDSLLLHPGVQDFRRVAVHELGHVAGLGHPTHANAVMYYVSRDIVGPQADDLAGLGSRYGVMALRTAPDTNGNSLPDIITVRVTNTGEIQGEVRDSATGELLRSMVFLNDGFQAVDVALLPDDDGSGYPEVAVLAMRRSDGRGVVEIRNLAGPENPRLVYFAPDLKPRRLANTGDADGNGIAELSMLASRYSDDRIVVDIRNSYGAIQNRKIYFSPYTSAVDLQVITDPAGVLPPRLAVLMVRWSDGRGQVELRDAIGSQDTQKVYLRPGVQVRSFGVLSAAEPSIAVLLTRVNDGRTLVDMYDLSGASPRATQWFALGYAPVALRIIEDADGDGLPDLALMAIRQGDGRIRAELRNVDGSNKRTRYLGPGFDPTGEVVVLDDIDGDTYPEIAILSSRQLDARRRVDIVDSAGAFVNTTRIWLSP